MCKSSISSKPRGLPSGTPSYFGNFLLLPSPLCLCVDLAFNVCSVGECGGVTPGGRTKERAADGRRRPRQTTDTKDGGPKKTGQKKKNRKNQVGLGKCEGAVTSGDRDVCL